MRNKVVSSFTLITFTIFSLSCFHIYQTKKEPTTKATSWKAGKVKILAVMKTSGEHIEFPKERPGRISNSSIIGDAEKEKEVYKEDIIELKRSPAGKIYEINTKDGQTYFFKRDIIHFLETDDKIFIRYYDPISIPLSEVELAWVKRVDPLLSFLTVIGTASIISGGLLLIVLLTKESCPFIYSFNGEEYIFDAEPYGGAICEGRKRTEWCGLENLREVNGKYKIMLTNEVDETQYTDELRLVIVDHPRDIKVVPDESGHIHTISQPLPPTQAYDGKGRDLRPYVSKNDWIFWQTRTEEKDPDRLEDLKDELIFEFSKPEGAEKVKLFFNGCNTLWASQMLKRFLELYGNKVYEYYDELNNFGPAHYRTMDWNLREELYRLQIRIETEGGWKSKGLIIGGGPFVSEDKVYLLDISDVPGDKLRIKLTPPAAFWMINHLAVDYTEDLPLQLAEIEPFKARDHKGGDVRELLAKNDNNYLVMPNIGDWAELFFESPPTSHGLQRSVILKASGYYDIHLDAEGEPRTEILQKLVNEPGYTIRYSLKEHLQWKKETMQRIESK